MTVHTAHPRTVLLADCDMFFVQVARLADPEGAGRASLLIVGGSADARGVVCSASYEARAYGVSSGMPTSRARRLCPAATFVPVPRALCSAKSAEIVQVLEEFSPDVASASPDEAYIELTSMMQTIYKGRSVHDVASQIRQAVRDQTGITISVGAGTNRLVAKIASGQAKPRLGVVGTGVHVVAPGDEAAFLASFALGDIPGIGPRLQERLTRFGGRNIVDLVSLDRSALRRAVGIRQGDWLFDVVRGIDDSPVARRDVPKSVGREETFPADIADDEILRREMLELADTAVADLRETGLGARAITVRIKDADFTQRQASKTLPEAVTTFHAVAPVAVELLTKLRKARRVPARLVGVTLSQLTAAVAGVQIGMFEDEDAAPLEEPRHRAVADAIDHLRAKFGRSAISFGSPRRRS